MASDGDGAVAAGPGIVIETDDAADDAWSFSPQPLPQAQNVSALAAYSDGSGQIEAVISVDLESYLDPNVDSGDEINAAYDGDIPDPVGAGQAPVLEPHDPLPDSGYVLEQTASGWVDMEHMTYPSAGAATDTSGDGPIRPNPVLALSVSPDGAAGLGDAGVTSALAQFIPDASLSGAAPAGTAAYSFESRGSSGTVAVIVLDYSQGSLGTTQQNWLAAQLLYAKDNGVPAIVVGADALGFTLPQQTIGDAPTDATDASTVEKILVQGGASAYLFDYPEANVQTTLTYGGQSIPAFGSGTLGYVAPAVIQGEDDLLGSSAFLVVSVETADRDASTNIAPVSAVAIPNIGSLALEATGGLLLRRSQVTLFDALAREEQAAIQNVHRMVAADPGDGGGGVPAWSLALALALIVIAAGAGLRIRLRPRFSGRRRRLPEYTPAPTQTRRADGERHEPMMRNGAPNR